MPRRINSISVGTYDAFIQRFMPICNEKLYKIDGAEVFIGDGGNIYITAKDEWCEYCLGRSNKIPSEPFYPTEDCDFEVADESVFLKFIGK